MHGRAFGPGRVVAGRLEHGRDLLDFLGEVARGQGIRMGWYSFFGAVRQARLAYYDQSARAYRSLVLEQPMEIAAGVGNVSLLDGEPFVHAHVVLSDERGAAFGGHVEPGTVIYAGEFALWELDGAEPLVRGPDPVTGLRIWPPR